MRGISERDRFLLLHALTLHDVFLRLSSRYLLGCLDGMGRASISEGSEWDIVRLHERFIQRDTWRLHFGVKMIPRIAKVFQREDYGVLFGVVKLNQLSVEELRAQLILAKLQTAHQLELLIMSFGGIYGSVKNLRVVTQRLIPHDRTDA